MTAIVVAQLANHPGKAQELIELCKEAKALGAKYGLRTSMRLLLMAGADAGDYWFVQAAADLTALATGLEKYFADPAWPSLQARLLGADGVCKLVSFRQANEIPL
jgi:hypothetical protein